MTIFVQPQNREKDLKAILDGYKKWITHEYWLAEAFQKDGIQNSWDARIGKGKKWVCKIFYTKINFPNKNIQDILGIFDHGTKGLTGTIPQSQTDIRWVLDQDDFEKKREERLSAFLAQDWSSKSGGELGSRGRGKAIFIASSKDKIIYFDSHRVSDNKYIFGSIFLDKKTKEIKVEVLSDVLAEQKRKSVFGPGVKTLQEAGTRIFIINPEDKLVEAITSGYIDTLIQNTWWEILEKNAAHIEIIIHGKSKKIERSPLLPVDKMSIKEIYHSGLIRLPNKPELKIKNISLCYLGEKEVPESYKGIAIQRGGMVVERYPTERLINESFAPKIYGSVEMETDLETEMHEHEGPEHYNFFWVNNPPATILRLIRQKIKEFATKFKLMEEEVSHVSKKQREMELTVQKKLNNVAKKLGLKGGGWTKTKKKRKTRNPNNPIRLSFSDFILPHENARVDTGESIKGVYVTPINETEKNIFVLVRIWVFNDKKIFLKEEKTLKIYKDNKLDHIGWAEIDIDNSFSPGKYKIRAKMISLENIEIGGNLQFEKGKEIYQIGRNFYVGIDPEEQGLFGIRPCKKEGKENYIWFDEGDESQILYYNLLHPVIRQLVDSENTDLLHDILMKEGILFIYLIRFAEDLQLYKNGSNSIFFREKDLRENDLEEIFNTLMKNRSITLWEMNK